MTPFHVALGLEDIDVLGEFRQARRQLVLEDHRIEVGGIRFAVEATDDEVQKHTLPVVSAIVPPGRVAVISEPSTGGARGQSVPLLDGLTLHG